MTNENTYNLRLPNDLKEKAQKKAEDELMPLSVVIRKLLKDWVEKS